MKKGLFADSIIVALVSFIVAGAIFPFNSAAQNISFRGGVTTLLYDNRYYPELWGPSSPRIPTATVKLGWEDHSGLPSSIICNRPEYGVAFSVDALGLAKAANGPGCGSIYSLYGYFDRAFVRTPRFSLEYSGGFGFGCCFNNLYDAHTNPWNWMLSLPVNAHISLGLQTKFMLTDRYYAGLGVYFNHNSNGAVNWMNNGFNGIEASLTFGMKDVSRKEPRAYAKGDKKHFDIDDGFKPSFIFDVHATGGIMSVEALWERMVEQTGEDVNLRKFKYGFHADCLYKYCRTQASGIGVDLFVTPFCDIIAENDGKGKSYDPVSFGISIVQEMRYRNLSAMLGLGRYLYDNDGLAPNKILYQIVNLRYHFPQLGNTYTGIVLKAHKFMAAESIQICIGKSF